ncbi:pre-mRNA splicing factor RNA helicase [Cyclospora cayetanensis]|uniref:RNA helicase n=1 Tax=Cyclospora cayetanensis TaxID=88456 RepID=A0A1D3CSN2_9EIME|nr:pre-mRNA splicing factor RNA helicase [Cyclospora cayetanensis]
MASSVVAFLEAEAAETRPPKRLPKGLPSRSAAEALPDTGGCVGTPSGGTFVAYSDGAGTEGDAPTHSPRDTPCQPGRRRAEASFQDGSVSVGQPVAKAKASRKVYRNLSTGEEGNPFAAAPAGEATGVMQHSAAHLSHNPRKKQRRMREEEAVLGSSSPAPSRSRPHAGTLPSGALLSKRQRLSSSEPATGGKGISFSHPDASMKRREPRSSRTSGGETDGGAAPQASPRSRAPCDFLASARERLPVWRYRSELLKKMEKHQVILVVGETGSGKTTQVPQLLLQARLGLPSASWIGVSQPRRVAAVSLARRVSRELGEAEVGGLVGYSVRFETVMSKRTRIRFLTDGMLVREALLDSQLRRFSALVLDEVHERSMQTDFLLGLAKTLAMQRPELKIVLMSATLQVDRLIQFFPSAAVISIPGATFPLKVLYTPEPQEDFLEVRVARLLLLPYGDSGEQRRGVHAETARSDSRKRRKQADFRDQSGAACQKRKEGDRCRAHILMAAMLSVLQIHLGEAGEGDILVFLPGQEEIETLSAMLRAKMQLLEAYVMKYRQEFGEEAEFSVRLGDVVYRHRKMQRLFVCAIYAALPFDQQQQVLQPAPPQYARKAVLATNIAETSLTVSGIRFVVDSGLRKAKARDYRTHSEALRLQEISQDSATQRGGRAGREAPGTVYRLYTEDCFHMMHAHRTPEILCCDLSQLFLQLKVLGVENPLEFPFLDAPPREAFYSAGRHLYRLEAIDSQGAITSLGRQMAALPLPPQLGALLLAAVSLECENSALTLAAMLSAENVWSASLNLPRGAAAALERARKRFTDPLSDHLTLVGAYNQWLQADDPRSFCREAGLQHAALLRAHAIRQQLQDCMVALGISKPSHLHDASGEAFLASSEEPQRTQKDALNLRRCLAKSYWQQAAHLQPESRQFVTAQRGHTPYSSSYEAKNILSEETQHGMKGGRRPVRRDIPRLPSVTAHMPDFAGEVLGSLQLFSMRWIVYLHLSYA